ncbi:hypothetical protein Rhe02_09580 [Rhizocola hellebori]|uniref:Uncharacterized protein n=1 Tax=Rhizocola hellebori TaxID=1392758 RepID=A0A8J3VE02_9ACTN|nr:hypothetical protein Rhe02_09580 [Rhizocola hellebori]
MPSERVTILDCHLEEMAVDVRVADRGFGDVKYVRNVQRITTAGNRLLEERLETSPQVAGANVLCGIRGLPPRTIAVNANDRASPQRYPAHAGAVRPV